MSKIASRVAAAEQLENWMEELKGERLTSIRFAVDLAMISFGSIVSVRDPVGGRMRVREWSLHINCGWRIVRNGMVVIGSHDLYLPRYDRTFRDFKREDALIWLRIDQLTNRPSKLLVRDGEITSDHGLVISLSRSHDLQLIPLVSSRRISDELWRLLRATDSYAVVASAKNIVLADENGNPVRVRTEKNEKRRI